MTPHLPAETLDHIFSFFHNDPATLRSIHNVCSESETHNSFLRGILDRHLYAHVVVTNFASTRQDLFHCSELFQYLSNNPHVSKYIRTLRIELEIPGQWYGPVSSILRMLPSTLKEIVLSNRTRSEANASTRKVSTVLRWSDLHETFRAAFLNCLCSSNLTDASLHCVRGVPLSVFNDCTMQKLSLRRVGVYSRPGAQCPPQTISLTIDQCDDLLTIRNWVQGGPNLRSLNFCSGDEYLYSEFLNKLYGESLTKIGLDFGMLFSLSYPPSNVKLKMRHPPYLDLSRLPNLTELTIWASIQCKSKGLWINSPIPSIAQVAATSPSLKRLILRIKIDPRSVDGIAKSKIWSPLLPLNASPSLEHIELGIISVSSKRLDINAISTLLRVSELKKMYEESFLSLKEVGE